MSSSQMGIQVDRREEGQNKIQLGEKEICILRGENGGEENLC